ncbi:MULTISPECIES: enoyl-CoA hydratase-related protein [Streptomyces]|uniref:enoyl-CoA hydratase-related protein n=1 Tax=Streptomyces TaxID=1883 RepID=UPI002E381037|nr:enoyl-CoA hydratase-related protein [Streptomyces canus]WSZ34860.1 enoyl-CoA hydratase-related protein [Streptomyces sp. NBC_00882]
MNSHGVRTTREGAELHVLLSRPDRLNALRTADLIDLTEAVEAAAGDDGVRVVLLAGEGRAFCSGADLASVVDASTVDAANRAILALRRIGKPVIAAVGGAAAGVGCSLALACDLVIAKRSAYFLLAFADVGLMPDGGATALVPAAVGRARAMRMAMLAERIPAQTATEWGLISQVVDDDVFDTEVASVTTRLAAGPPLAYARIKRAVDEAAMPALARALEIERTGQAELLRSRDYAEGVAAFKDRRKPKFTGT